MPRGWARRIIPTATAAVAAGFDIAYTDAGRSHRVSMDWDVLIVTDTNGCVVPRDL